MIPPANPGGTPEIAGQPAGRAAPARRRWILAAAGVLAIAAGAAVGWRRGQLGEADGTGLWELSLATPDGDNLALAELKGRPLLVNFWATWCPPCIEELPLLSRTYAQRKGQGWQIIGIAIDQPEPVRQFLNRSPVSFPVAVADMSAVGLTKALGNTQGGLPFTVVFDANGQLRHRKLGQLKPSDLDDWMK